MIRVVGGIHIVVGIIVAVRSACGLGPGVESLLASSIRLLISTKRLRLGLVVIRASRLYTVRVMRQAAVSTLMTRTAIIKTEVIFLTILFFF